MSQLPLFDVPLEDYRPLGPVPRSEQCLCGGWIRVVNQFDEREVAEAVRLHNETDVHLAWRMAR